MTLKAYIWGIRIMTTLSLMALGMVLYYVNPEGTGVVEKIVFYIVIFFALSGIFNLFLFFLRRYALGPEAVASAVALNFRQSILLAALAVVLLILQSFRMLSWWDALLAVAGMFLIELYFLSRN